MSNVNTGNVSPEAGPQKQKARLTAKQKRGIGAPSGLENCALCTAAGIIKLKTGRDKTSGQVALDLGLTYESDGAFAIWRKSHVKDLNGRRVDHYVSLPGTVYAEDDPDTRNQVEGLIFYCTKMTGALTLLHGNSVDDVDYAVAKKWMLDQPNGTCFAVWWEPDSSFSHWLCAEKRNDELKFVDYQPDMAFSLPKGSPIVADEPFVGVDLDSGVIASEFATNKVIVAAYR